MGSELRRMIRDGAPPSWTGPMVHVAGEIADDARDPGQGLAEDGGWPWSAIPVRGQEVRGRWRDGLTERTGMSARAIARALADLAAAGYEMREPIGTDKRGRQVFAARGHALRFRVPPLSPRPEPEWSPGTASIGEPKAAKDGNLPAGERSPRTPERSPRTAPKVAKDGDPSYPGLTHIPSSADGSVTGGSVEVSGNGAGPVENHDDVSRRMSKLERAAWQAAGSRRQRAAASGNCHRCQAILAGLAGCPSKMRPADCPLAAAQAAP